MLAARTLLVPLLLVVPLAASCGGGDGGGFSVEEALGDLVVAPDADADDLFVVTVVDLEAAAEANGAERPDNDADADEVQRWLGRATGTLAPEGEELGPVFVPVVDTVGFGRAAAEDIEDELGWSPVAVGTLAEVQAVPYRFAVVTGEVGEETLATADLEDLGDGIYSRGTGDDLEADSTGDLSVRPTGAPLRMTADGDAIALSSSTDAVEGWRDDGTVADHDDVRAVAAALDDGDAISALIFAGDRFDADVPTPSEAARQELPITEAFRAVGVGYAVDDGEPAVTVAYAFGDDGAAEAAADQVEAAFTDAVSGRTGEPIADVLDLDGVEVDGSVVVARVRPVEDGQARLVAQMLSIGDTPFVHA